MQNQPWDGYPVLKIHWIISWLTCHSFSISYQTTACTNLSTAMATRVNTDAETDTPCTKPLILHTVLEKGQPVEQKWQTLNREVGKTLTEFQSAQKVNCDRPVLSILASLFLYIIIFFFIIQGFKLLWVTLSLTNGLTWYLLWPQGGFKIAEHLVDYTVASKSTTCCVAGEAWRTDSMITD